MIVQDNIEMPLGAICIAEVGEEMRVAPLQMFCRAP